MTRHDVEKYEYFPIDVDQLLQDYTDFVEVMGHVTDDETKIDFNAVCINRKPGDPSSVTGGNVRGKYWTYPHNDVDEEERLPYIDEAAYTEICPEFEGSYTEEIYNELQKYCKLGRVRFLMKPPRTCLSWHRDPERRLHIPLVTNRGCKMIVEDKAYYMPADGTVYIVDNTKYHNFFNGSEKNRVHLVATVVE